MKLIIILLFPLSLLAQPGGNWQGQMSGEGGSLNSTMQINVAGNQLNGAMHLHQNGMKETYLMSGTVSGNTATGKMTLNGQEAMTFILESTGNQCTMRLSLLGQQLFKGTYTRTSANVSPQGKVSDAGLSRDPALLGKWFHETTWTGGSNTEYYIFNADGTLDGYKKGYVAAYSNNANASSVDEGSKIADVEQLKALGARWYTRNSQFCVKFTLEGKPMDKCTSRYNFVDGILKLTDLNSGKVVYYRRAR